MLRELWGILHWQMLMRHLWMLCIIWNTVLACFLHFLSIDDHHHHHIRHNNPGRDTASLRIRLQTSLSLATVHQFWIFNFFTSSWTTSLHLEQGLPTPLLPSGLPSIIHLTISSFFISHNIVRVIKSRRLRWAGKVARMEEGRSAFKILTGTSAGKA